MIKKQEFDYFLNKNEVHITLVTETWLHSYTNNYYNYDIIRCNSPCIVSEDLAIIVNTRVEYHILSNINYLYVKSYSLRYNLG